MGLRKTKNLNDLGNHARYGEWLRGSDDFLTVCWGIVPSIATKQQNKFTIQNKKYDWYSYPTRLDIKFKQINLELQHYEM